MPAAGLIVLAVVAAYGNSFAGVFVYDDLKSIAENQTIRQLWPIGEVLSPPRGGETVSGRPLLNLSLAVNYAISGLQIWSYHAANLLIHIAAALLLFGILRRTFLLPALQQRFGQAATWLALAAAVLWALHPLQTESVTYVAQRAESLMGLFYLLTLYCVIRGTMAGTVPFFSAHQPVSSSAVPGAKGDCPPRRRLALVWYALAVWACLSGMATKEVMVTAPLVVLLYDRTFLSGSLIVALRRRWALYLGLAATWGLLAYLMFSTRLVFRQEEMGSPSAWQYARTQPGVILYYLRLSLWPGPLCFDYAWPVADTFWEIVPGAVVLAALLAATLWGLVRRRAWGFLGAWFFLILAPTSSILPLRQLAFEHRMYLSLAAVAGLVVAGGYRMWETLLTRASPGSQWSFSLPMALPNSGSWAAKKGTVRTLPTAMRWAAPVVAWAVVAAALGFATAARNANYQSLLTIYQDTVAKSPHNFLAHNNLGTALAVLGETDQAIAQFRQALRLNPHSTMAHANLGLALARLGKMEEATAQYREALRITPDYSEAHNNLGLALAELGRYAEAVECYRQALRIKPDDADANYNLAIALAAMGRTSEAIDYYRQALRLKPDFAHAHNNLGTVLAILGRNEEAIQQYRQAVQLEPDYFEAHNNLGLALATTGKTDEAIAHYRAALHIKADYVEAHNNLGLVLAALGRTAEAIEHYDKALRLRPNDSAALSNLAWLLATREAADGGDAMRAVQLAQQLSELGGKENALSGDILAAAYAAAGRFADAVDCAQQAVQLAESTGQAGLAQLIRPRLELYRAGRPYREGPRPAQQAKP